MIDVGIREISTARPVLRRDIRTHYQEYRGEPSYLIEDVSDGRFYHIGFPEHQFLQSLDGRRTVAEAIARNAATQGEEALTESQARQVLRWLIDNNLLDDETTDQAERRKSAHVRRTGEKPKNRVQQLLFFKIPLGCPNSFLNRITPFTAWIFSAAGLLLWLCLLVYAGFQLAPNWDRFVAATGQVIAPGNWWRIALLYALLKVLHEIGHGVAVKKHGGDVPSWGVQLLVFVTPLAFVDASASWKFPNRWHRILVSSAGMYVELAVAALCLVFWTRTDPGLLNSSLHSVVIAASTVTLLFNANPLMRFDGYYIMVDLLGIPNLATKGQAFLKWFGKRIVLGMKDTPFPPNVKSNPVVIPLYGILAAIWKLVIYAGIIAVLSFLLKGAGLALVILLLVMVVWGSLASFSRYVLSPGGPGIARAASRLLAVIGILAAVCYFVKVNPAGRICCVAIFAESEGVRVDCAGEILEVRVRPRQRVAKGEILATMRNRDEETARDQMRLELKEARVRKRQYYEQENLAAFQAEMETIEGLEKSLAEKESYLRSLILRAPVEGTVIGRDLDSLTGRWVQVGEEVMKIDNGESRELLLSISQKDMKAIRNRTGDEVVFLLRGREREMEGRLKVIESQATSGVPHEALISVNGGPLSIRSTPEQESRREEGITRGSDSDLTHFSGLEAEQRAPSKLVEPRFAARVELPSPEGHEIREGEWGYAAFENVSRERLGSWLWQRIGDYVRGLKARAFDASGPRAA